MKMLLILSVVLISTFAQATCKLPSSEPIVIGCTEKCDFFTRSRLKAVGATLGYRVKFRNLSFHKDVTESLSIVDSVLIPGGADINPKFYLKNVTPEMREYTQNNLHLVKFTDEGKRRDIFEYTLLKLFLKFGSHYKKLPLLGICRGMQMMSVAQGIPLYLDIKTELGIPNRMYKFDRVTVTDEESLMRTLYGDRKFLGFELHHQGIRVDYYEAHKNEFPSVKVSSFSNDGLVAESIEYKDMTALGVQYHPEKSFPGTTYPVFKWLLTKACEYKTTYKDKQ
jgi:gamma-glutamyl-gamma-aminobutyrate hydrolase PuuD